MAIIPAPRATKIIRSFDGNALTADHGGQVASEDWDALRIVYPTDGLTRLTDFIASLRGSLPESRVSSPIMVDLSPRARAVIDRCGTVFEELALGQKLTFGSSEGADVILDVGNFNEFVAPDVRMYIGYGNVELKVVAVSNGLAQCEVLKGGNVEPGMEAHIPSTKKPDAVKDFEEVRFDLLKELDVRHLIVSGTLGADAIRGLKANLEGRYGYRPWMFVKIDGEAAYMRLGSILAEVEGVVISRREMSLSINPSMIPMITKEIIQKCNDEAKIAVAASEVLGSMRKSPTPTRAEVSDVANMVLDGANAVVLTEEVTMGPYADRALSLLNRIILDTEDNSEDSMNWKKHLPPIRDEVDAISFGAYQTADRIGARAIVCITQQGNTALRLASFNPPLPVIAVTFQPETLYRLALVKGVQTIYLPEKLEIEQVLPFVNNLLKNRGVAQVGDRILFVAITLSSVGSESSNLFTIQHIH